MVSLLSAKRWAKDVDPSSPVVQVYDLDSCQNKLPTSEIPSYERITNPKRGGTEASLTALVPRIESKWKTLFWPAIAITVPLALLSATLLALVFGYRVKPETNLFEGDAKSVNSDQSGYLLVNFSATRLVFAASFLSTVAPLLASFIMSLWSLIASAEMTMASTKSRFEFLPTPYQLSLLIGLCLASVEQLRTYLFYLVSRKRNTTLPPVLNRSAMLFFFIICLASAVFLSDTALHYQTSTIVFDQIAVNHSPAQEFGYGLSSLCLDLDRVNDNAGFPCSQPTGEPFDDLDRTAKRNEINRLQSNTSLISQIRLTNADNFDGKIAIMIPQSAGSTPGVDFRASTVGISTQCRLVAPSACNMTAFGNDDTFTRFNCSNDYFGVLGKSPNISAANGMKADDPDLSPLAFRPAINLDWAFFENANLSTVYNPESWDPSIDQPDGTNIFPDDQLLNPFYLGMAMRVSVNTFTVNSSIIDSEPNAFDSGNGYREFVFSCAIKSHLVDYTWYNASIQRVTEVPSGNGSLLEVFHGTQTYNTVTGGGVDLQQYIIDAAIAGNDTNSFVTTWADLYSVKVLAVIGAYLAPRTNLQEQSRRAILVAKVPKLALGSLIGCSLIYTVVGIVLAIAAHKADTKNVAMVAEQLSLAGLTNAAFGERNSNTSDTKIKTGEEAFDSSIDSGSNDHLARLAKTERRKVRVSGSEFRVWV